jgi:hypothetical protein
MSGAGDFEVHQEADVVASAPLLRVGVVSVVVGAVGVFFAGLILVWVVGALRPSFAKPGGPAPAPREIAGIEQTPIWQTRAGEDLLERQRRELDRWSWVDRRTGIANIPIDRAMDLVVEESR